MIRFLRFGFVGTVGFAVDAAVLVALAWLGLPAAPARVVSIGVGMMATFALNREITFTRRPVREALPRYVVVNSGGAIVNLLAFNLVLLAPEVPLVVAVGIGSLTGLVVNYLGSARWAFAGRSPAKEGDSIEEPDPPS